MNAIAVIKTKSVWNYIEVLKPRESGLHTLMGVVAALVAVGDIVASGNVFPLREFVLAAVAIACGIPGCNGLTNYLDRNVDAQMQRTCLRALPSRRIYPPEKSLPVIVTLVILGLALAWLINLLCFICGLVGVIAAVLWRKTSLEVFLGIVAGWSPVLIGWFAIKPVFSLQILSICLLVAVWIPLHVWSLMVAYRDDYRNAGLHYFPLNWEVRKSVRLLFSLAFLLFAISIFVFFAGEFHLPYLIVAIILGVVMISACGRLLTAQHSKAAWQVYKLTAFPYLGVIFITMCLDAWLF
ncbi:MAG: UbiA family prenyltransferase [Chloroflexota bacterium]|nr:UbiA family prenyltransferase [Chloroflexota bacterium]